MGDHNKTIQYMKEHMDSFLAVLGDVVNLESYVYGDRAVKNECGAYIEKLFQEIGFNTWREDVQESGMHICGRRGNGSKRIFLLGHYDTVFEMGTTKKRPFKIEGDKAFGPGIFDMKGGIISFYYALKALIALNALPHDMQITFFFSCDEEGGSITSRKIIETMALESDVCLVGEPGHKGEGYITSERYGRDVVTVRAKGVAAHAGNNPQSNPIIEIARQAIYIHENCRDGDLLYASIVSSHGGEAGATAMTPGECYLIADIRYKDDVHGKMAADAINSIAAFNPDVLVEVTGGVEKPALRQGDFSKKLMDTTQHVIGAMGFAYQPACLGGGSDGNFTSAIGCPTIDGLGLNGAFLHNPREYVDILTIPQRVALVAELIQAM